MDPQSKVQLLYLLLFIIAIGVVTIVVIVLLCQAWLRNHRRVEAARSGKATQPDDVDIWQAAGQRLSTAIDQGDTDEHRTGRAGQDTAGGDRPHPDTTEADDEDDWPREDDGPWSDDNEDAERERGWATDDEGPSEPEWKVIDDDDWRSEENTPPDPFEDDDEDDDDPLFDDDDDMRGRNERDEDEDDDDDEDADDGPPFRRM